MNGIVHNAKVIVVLICLHYRLSWNQVAYSNAQTISSFCGHAVCEADVEICVSGTCLPVRPHNARKRRQGILDNALDKLNNLFKNGSTTGRTAKTKSLSSSTRSSVVRRTVSTSTTTPRQTTGGVHDFLEDFKQWEKVTIKVPWLEFDPWNPCTPNPCLNNGVCKVVPAKQGYECECPGVGHDPRDHCHYCLQGYFEKNCERKCGACGESTYKFPAIQGKPRIYKYNVYRQFSSCHPETGCATCKLPFNNPPYCDRSTLANFNATNRKLDPCIPGRWVRDHCQCPLGLGGLTCKDKASPGTPCRAGEYVCSGGGTCYVYDAEFRCLCPDGALEVGGRNAWGCVTRCVPRSMSCLYGSCRGGACICEAGYTGAYCRNRCPLDTWGSGCSQKCGFCATLPCQPGSGLCPEAKCLPGFTGVFCKELLPGAKPTVTARFKLTFAGEYLSSGIGRIIQYIDIAARQAVAEMAVAHVHVFPTFAEEGSVVVGFALVFNQSEVTGINVAIDVPNALQEQLQNLPSVPGYKVQPGSLQLTSLLTPDDLESTSKQGSDGASARRLAIVVVGGLITVLIPASFCVLMVFKRRVAGSSSSARQHSWFVPSYPSQGGASAKLYRTRLQRSREITDLPRAVAARQKRRSSPLKTSA